MRPIAPHRRAAKQGATWMTTGLVTALLVGQPGATAMALDEAPTVASDRAYIERILDLANNADQEWTYAADADAWVLSIVPAVAYPELPDQQGVSVAVPGAYVSGIDTDDDGVADVTSESDQAAVRGSPVIDDDASVTSTNGQVYTAATAPVILNTGAAGYGSQSNSLAATDRAADGYINVAIGNRGKRDTLTDENGDPHFTGDAPDCLADQKAAARFVKYNILLGNLPGSVGRFVSTGGSGGGAHATMFAATSNNPDFYDYEIAAGAVGVYRNEDGSYSTTVTIDGTDHEISDGAWGSIAYSAITSLHQGDTTMAAEYELDPAYGFKTPFQAQLAEYLSAAYMDDIDSQGLSVDESALGFDLTEDGDMDDTVALTIEYDPKTHPETNGYYGSYLDLYLAEFTANLQWYLDNLDYAEGWTWFGEDGTALSDDEVASMTSADKAAAFIEGRYAKSASAGGGPGGMAGPPSGDMGTPPGDMGAPPDMSGTPVVGTPGEGTTASSAGQTDSTNYATYADMVAAYEADITSIEAGDEYGNDIVSLYDPLAYIGAEGTEDPTWTRIVMGAAEGDMSMFASLNLEIAWLDAGVDAVIEWQWDGGHVPSETLGDSFSLYVDEMVGEHVDGAVMVTKATPTAQTTNGTETESTGTDISNWVDDTDISHGSFSLADAAAYRTAHASKAIPGFDVMDYGQEDYVFGNPEVDARHWDGFVLDAFQTHADVLEPLFNAE
jgi:hypothetical protein